MDRVNVTSLTLVTLRSQVRTSGLFEKPLKAASDNSVAPCDKKYRAPCRKATRSSMRLTMIQAFRTFAWWFLLLRSSSVTLEAPRMWLRTSTHEEVITTNFFLLSFDASLNAAVKCKKGSSLRDLLSWARMIDAPTFLNSRTSIDLWWLSKPPSRMMPFTGVQFPHRAEPTHLAWSSERPLCWSL